MEINRSSDGGDSISESNSRRDQRWKRGVLVAVYALLAIVPIGLAWLPYTSSLTRFLYEDFFYYLQVARQALEGNGSTFDGEAPTNGYHPMWMLLSIAAYASAGHVMCMYVMLMLGALLHLLQAYLIFDTLRRLTLTVVAHATAMLFIVNYRLISCNLCGLETPLQGVFVLLVLRTILLDHAPLNLWRALLWGVLLGLAVWARFDLVLLAIFVLAYMVIQKRFHARIVNRLGYAMFTAVIMVVVLLPWFVFSYNNSGVLLPNSSRALSIHNETQRFDLSHGLAANAELLRGKFFGASTWLGDTSNLLGLSSSVPPSYSNYGGLSIGLLGLILAAYCWWCRRDAIGFDRFLLLAYAAAQLSYYSLFVRAEVRYLMPFCLIMIVLMAMMLGAWLKHSGRWGSLIIGVAYLVLCYNVIVSGKAAWDKGWGATRTHADHIHLYNTALWIRDNLPPDAKIGAWNAGILAYFSDRTVVNLDGVINDEAIEALAQHQLADYIEQRNIDFLVDLEVQMTHYMNQFSGRPDWAENFEEISREGPVVIMRAVDATVAQDMRKTIKP